MTKLDRANAPYIAPSLLSADFSRLKEELRAVEEAGADLHHVDVMDGHFVPNITIGPLVVEAMKRSAAAPLDVHLMIENPERYAADFRAAGADILTVHTEACLHLHRTVQQIRDLGMLVGVSLNPATPVSLLAEILPMVDMVLVMSVNPGFGGQKFIPQALGKIERLRAMAEDLNPGLLIEVDGGVGSANAGELFRAGADILVAGSAIFHSADYAETIRSMRAACGRR
jgi:ribulose-phosphate 3-epimerase